MALSLTQLGVYVWRMNAPNDRQSLLNEVDVSLSMDAQMTPTGKITGIEIDMGRLLVRFTRSDIELLSNVLSNAMALSRIESPKTSAEPAKPVVHAPSVLNKITDAHEDNGQVLSLIHI